MDAGGSMQSTLQTRLRLSNAASQLLDQIAGLYRAIKRKFYARMAADGGKAKLHKTAFWWEPVHPRAGSTDWKTHVATYARSYHRAISMDIRQKISLSRGVMRAPHDNAHCAPLRPRL